MADVGGITTGPNTSALSNAVGTDQTRAAEFYRRLAMLQQQYQQQLQAQGALGRSYDQVISGQAPSVAGTQLQQGLGDIRNTVAAQASGAGGNNAALANYGSIQALAQAQNKANQDAAILRAKEVAQARDSKSQLLNQQQQATGNMYGDNTGATTSLAGTEANAAGNLAKMNEDEINSRRALISNLINSAGHAAAAA
jgi:hypothetical protein